MLKKNLFKNKNFEEEVFQGLWQNRPICVFSGKNDAILTCLMPKELAFRN